MPNAHISIDGISKAYVDHPVLQDISFAVPPGERVALIGENGAGKTTLVRIVAGEMSPDTGRVTHPARIGLLHQEFVTGPGQSVDDAVHRALAPVLALAAAVETQGEQLAAGEISERVFAGTLERAEWAQAWSTQARVETTLAGLGLAGLDRSTPVGAISGGQRRRLALARLLLERPVALVLDEPTNHLDDEASDFLVRELANWRGPVLMASHDRAFLDACATRIVDLDPAMGALEDARQGTAYQGSYSDYLRERERARVRWAESFAAEQEERNRLRQVVDVGARNIFHTSDAPTEVRVAKKFYSDRAAKTVGGRVRSARGQLEALERRQLAKPPEPLSFKGFHAHRGRTPIDLIVREAGIPGRLAPISLHLEGQARLLVTGPNGSGKSTLLQIIDGTLAPATGSRECSPRLTVRRLAQDIRWRSPELSLRQHAERQAVDGIDAYGLVHPRDLSRPLSELSVGTRRRCALALVLAAEPDILLLDEPTNHLSLALTEELEAALPDYPGAVVIASHDRWLRSRWSGPVLPLMNERFASTSDADGADSGIDGPQLSHSRGRTGQ